MKKRIIVSIKSATLSQEELVIASKVLAEGVARNINDLMRRIPLPNEEFTSSYNAILGMPNMVTLRYIKERLLKRKYKIPRGVKV